MTAIYIYILMRFIKRNALFTALYSKLVHEVMHYINNIIYLRYFLLLLYFYSFFQQGLISNFSAYRNALKLKINYKINNNLS